MLGNRSPSNFLSEREKETGEKLNTRLELGLDEADLKRKIIHLKNLLNKPPIAKLEGLCLNEIKGYNLKLIKDNFVSCPHSEQQINDAKDYRAIVEVKEKMIKENQGVSKLKYQRLEDWFILCWYF